jgi:hypothetical protein
MGLFDLFKKKSPLEKHRERVANKRAQGPDRWESIQVLGKMATTEPTGDEADERADAVAALVERFTFYVDPSITDGEEKDEAFRWICGAGEVAVKPVREAAQRHESLSWPLRMLEHLLDEERLIDEMIGILESMDTEYERDPQRKLQLLSSLEEKRAPRIAEAVAPFFLDVNEEARFHALGAAVAQENAEEVLPQLLEALTEEESVRVKARALDAMAEHGWSLGEAKADVELPDGYATDSKGVPRKAKKKK